MPYIHRIRRPNVVKHYVTPVKAVEPEPEPSYRDLQAQAKDRGIPANQTADELKEAIEESSHE